GIGFTPLIPKAKPVSNTAIQTARDRHSLADPRTVVLTMDAAYGDVIADEKPAAKSPAARANDPQFPTLAAISAASSGKDPKLFIVVPAMSIAAVIPPPITTDMTRPARINGMVWPLLMPAPIKIL